METAIPVIKNIASYIYPVVIEKCTGKYTPFLEVNLFNGRLTLDTDKVNYSYGSLYKIFDQSFHQFNLKERNIRHALILGFGAGSVASLLSEKYCKDCEITGIEIDSVVIDIAKRYFDISRFRKLKLICEDAYKYIQHHPKQFDLIIIDLYIGDQVPEHFHKKEFLKQLELLLLYDGILFFNKVVNSPKQKAEFNELAKNIEEIFGYSFTYKLHRAGTNNYMLIHDKKML